MTEEKHKELIKIATEAMQWSYSNYSGYAVGSALLTRSGKVYDGANIENAVFPLTMCAERVAVFKAASQGEREFEAIAVVTRDGGSPCGSCRQVLAEFGLDTIVLIADDQGNLRQTTSVGELLPLSFGPQNLTK